MAFKIASWNVEGRLSQFATRKRGTPNHILDSLSKLRADIVYLPEAFNTEYLDDSVRFRLSELGYDMIEVPYQDSQSTTLKDIIYQPSMMFLSKLPIITHQVVRLGELRNAICVGVKDPTTGAIVRIIGVHLDDRSELLRLKQVPDLVQLVRATSDPVIVLGDFNAMHGGDLLPSRLMRSLPVRAGAKYVMPDLALRAVDMARGETLKRLISQTTLRDVDPWHRPTTTPKLRGREWLPSVRLMQIDHILASSTLSISNFRVSTDGGADHRAISALVALDKIV